MVELNLVVKPFASEDKIIGLEDTETQKQANTNLTAKEQSKQEN